MSVKHGMGFKINKKSHSVFFVILVAVFLGVVGAILGAVQTNSYLLKSSLFSRFQPASVASGLNGCYTENDITTLKQTQTQTSTDLQNINNQLGTLDPQINETTNTLDSATRELEDLKSNLTPQDILDSMRQEMNLIQTKLAESQGTPADSGICSGYGLYTKADCESAGEYTGSYCTNSNFTTEASCLADTISTPGGCQGAWGMYNDKYSCESAGSETWGYGAGGSTDSCSGGSHTDRDSCINDGYYSGGGCSGPYGDEYSCLNAGEFIPGSCTGGPAFTNQNDCESAGAHPAYCTGGDMYDESTCAGAGAYAGSCTNSTYTDEPTCSSARCLDTSLVSSEGDVITYQDYVSNTSAWSTWVDSQFKSCGEKWDPGSTGNGYEWIPASTGDGYVWTPPTFRSYNHTYTPPTFYSYNYTYNQSWYAPWTSWITSSGYTWIEPTTTSAGSQWIAGVWQPHNYTWTLTDVATEQQNLTQSLALLSDQYTQALDRNSAFAPLIQSAEDTVTALSTTLRDQSTERSRLKGVQAELEGVLSGVDSEIAVAEQGVCGETTATVDPIVVDSTEQTIAQNINVSKSYYNGFSTLVSSKNNIEKNNTEKTIPAMQSLRAMSQSQDIDLILSTINSVREIVLKNQADLAGLKRSIDVFQTENDTNTDYGKLKASGQIVTQASTALYSSYSAYFNTLLNFLTGEVPTPELEAELNSRIANLKATTLDFEYKTADVKAVLDEAKKQAPIELSSVSLSPGVDQTGVSVGGTREIVIQFDHELDQYHGGDISVTSDSGLSTSAINVKIDDTQKDTLHISLLDTLRFSTPYLVALDLQLTVEGKPVEWKKSWSFVTENDQTFVGGVIDFFKGLFDGNANKLDGNQEDTESEPDSPAVISSCLVKGSRQQIYADQKGEIVVGAMESTKSNDWRDMRSEGPGKGYYDCSRGSECCSLDACKDSRACLPQEDKNTEAAYCPELYQEANEATRHLRDLQDSMRMKTSDGQTTSLEDSMRDLADRGVQEYVDKMAELDRAKENYEMTQKNLERCPLNENLERLYRI